MTEAAWLQQVRAVENGFLVIQQAADALFATLDAATCLSRAQLWLEAPEYQVRSLAVFLLGRLASESPESLQLLRTQVSGDADWRVQEILAKAFDRYCADIGYAEALPVIRAWLADPAANVRRAVSEGLRIWTGRPHFKDHPEQAIALLAALRADESEYVRKSAGNALRDISKKHPQRVAAELQTWDAGNRSVAQTLRLAERFLRKG